MNVSEQYRRAVEVLREGGVVALPTDTVYGLCAVATDAGAVDRIYEIKSRDPSQPLPLFIASIDQARLVSEWNAAAWALARAFWPGAMTLVLPRKRAFITKAAGGESVGLRAPSDPVLREMAAQLGPLTGTSANIAGREECHTASEVRAQLGDAVDLIVDAPPAASGQPSTVVDCTDGTRVKILRQGGISSAQIAEALAGTATVE